MNAAQDSTWLPVHERIQARAEWERVWGKRLGTLAKAGTPGWGWRTQYAYGWGYKTKAQA